MHGGYLGVDLFFVLSGYLITYLLVPELQAWPRLVVAVLRGRGGLRRLGGVAVGLTVVTAGWGWWITRSGISVSRGYYGTDTRAPSLLIGALLAIALTAHPVVRGRLAVS